MVMKIHTICFVAMAMVVSQSVLAASTRESNTERRSRYKLRRTPGERGETGSTHNVAASEKTNNSERFFQASTSFDRGERTAIGSSETEFFERFLGVAYEVGSMSMDLVVTPRKVPVTKGKDTKKRKVGKDFKKGKKDDSETAKDAKKKSKKEGKDSKKTKGEESPPASKKESKKKSKSNDSGKKGGEGVKDGNKLKKSDSKSKKAKRQRALRTGRTRGTDGAERVLAGCWFETSGGKAGSKAGSKDGSKAGNKDGSKDGSKDGGRAGSKAGSKDGGRVGPGRRLERSERELYNCEFKGSYTCCQVRSDPGDDPLCCKGDMTVLGVIAATPITPPPVVVETKDDRPEVYLQKDDEHSYMGGPAPIVQKDPKDDGSGDVVDKDPVDDGPYGVSDRPVPYMPVTSPVEDESDGSESNDFIKGNSF